MTAQPPPRAAQAPVAGPVALARFVLIRDTDGTDVSGSGVVAERVQFTDSSVVARWRGAWPVTAVWPSLAGVIAVHGHVGATRVRWLDPDVTADPPARATPPTPQSPPSPLDRAAAWPLWEAHDDPTIKGRS